MAPVPKQVGLQAAIANMATGGAVVLPVATPQTVIEMYRAIRIAQTTAGQVITLPNPSDQSIMFDLQVSNTGSASFTMYGVTITAGGNATMYWNGTAWGPDVSPTQAGPTLVNLTPTAQNTIPNVGTAPRAGTPQEFFVNGILVPSGITMSALGAITYTAATVGYNIEVTDQLTVVYYT